MTRCKRISPKKRLICIGSMKHPISIIDREIETLSEGYTMDFSNSTSVLAAIETRNGTPVFNGVNIEQELTHIFYIRYGESTVENNYTILFNNKYYRVIDFENLEEENRFLKITTIERGDIAKKANWA